MKKLLITIVIILLLILIGITAVKGIEIGNLKILGITQIKEKNDNLDKEIQEATKLASTDYKKSIDDLNNTVKELENKKEEYQNLMDTNPDLQETIETQFSGYKIEYLWVQIGNHAKSEGIELKMVVDSSSSGDTTRYNLNFTATGSYIGIADFIADIEDNSSLGFKIEDFKMTPTAQNGSTIESTFTCKNIKITGISNNTVTTPNTNQQNNNTTNNTTDNNTISNNTTNNNTVNNT